MGLANHLDVEVGEESHEHDRVEAHSVGDDDRVVAAVEKELNSVQENDDELDHLHGGQILLPPEIFLVLRSHSSHQVVAVHDHVDEGVEHTEEGAVTSGSELDTPPASSRHHAVVDNVQVGDLVVLFAQDEEDGVQEFSELAEEVPPAHVRHGNLIRIVRIVDRLAFQTVLPEPGVDQTLSGHIQFKLIIKIMRMAGHLSTSSSKQIYCSLYKPSGERRRLLLIIGTCFEMRLGITL